MSFPVDLADLFASMDLEEVKRALIREATIRQVMAETSEDRQTVVDIVDAVQSMDQEMVLDLTQGDPTTLVDALQRYVDSLATGDPDPERIAEDLTTILNYHWSGEEATWRSRLAREIYEHADRLEREPENRSLGVTLASIVRHVGDQIGRMPR